MVDLYNSCFFDALKLLVVYLDEERAVLVHDHQPVAHSAAGGSADLAPPGRVDRSDQVFTIPVGADQRHRRRPKRVDRLAFAE